MILSGATTPGQSGPGSNGNEEALPIPKSSCITEALPSDCLMLYHGHSLRESYFSAEMQSMYSTIPGDGTTLIGGVLSLYRDVIGVFRTPKRLDHTCWRSLTPLQKCSRCTLQPQATEPHSLGGFLPVCIPR